MSTTWGIIDEMRAAGQTEATITIGQLEQWRALTDELCGERDQLIDWQNTVADRMPSRYDGDEGQEVLIDRWMSDITGAVRLVLVRSQQARVVCDRTGHDGVVTVEVVADYITAIINALTPVLEEVDG